MSEQEINSEFVLIESQADVLSQAIVKEGFVKPELFETFRLKVLAMARAELYRAYANGLSRAAGQLAVAEELSGLSGDERAKEVCHNLRVAVLNEVMGVLNHYNDGPKPPGIETIPGPVQQL